MDYLLVFRWKLLRLWDSLPLSKQWEPAWTIGDLHHVAPEGEALQFHKTGACNRGHSFLGSVQVIPGRNQPRHDTNTHKTLLGRKVWCGSCLHVTLVRDADYFRYRWTIFCFSTETPGFVSFTLLRPSNVQRLWINFAIQQFTALKPHQLTAAICRRWTLDHRAIPFFLSFSTSPSLLPPLSFLHLLISSSSSSLFPSPPLLHFLILLNLPSLILFLFLCHLSPLLLLIPIIFFFFPSSSSLPSSLLCPPSHFPFFLPFLFLPHYLFFILLPAPPLLPFDSQLFLYPSRLAPSLPLLLFFIKQPLSSSSSSVVSQLLQVPVAQLALPPVRACSVQGPPATGSSVTEGRSWMVTPVSPPRSAGAMAPSAMCVWPRCTAVWVPVQSSRAASHTRKTRIITWTPLTSVAVMFLAPVTAN